jgi:hypothetical protein
VSLEEIAVTVERAAELLHCGRTRVFALLADGTLERAQSFGKRTLVLTRSIAAALEGPPLEAAKPKRARRSRSAQFAAELRAAVAPMRAGSSR